MREGADSIDAIQRGDQLCAAAFGVDVAGFDHDDGRDAMIAARACLHVLVVGGKACDQLGLELGWDFVGSICIALATRGHREEGCSGDPSTEFSPTEDARRHEHLNGSGNVGFTGKDAPVDTLKTFLMTVVES